MGAAKHSSISGRALAIALSFCKTKPFPSEAGSILFPHFKTSLMHVRYAYPGAGLLSRLPAALLLFSLPFLLILSCKKVEDHFPPKQLDLDLVVDGLSSP